MKALAQTAALIAAFVTLAPAVGNTGARTANLDGVWQIVGSTRALRAADGTAPPLLPGVLPGGTDPMAKCLPPGIPRLLMQPLPFRIQQQSKLVSIIFQWNHLYRLIYLDSDHFEAVSKAYLGQSVGKWQGRQLKVDSTGFNAATWLDDAGLPHSEALHLIETYSLRDHGNGLEVRLLIEDPQTFSRPWEAVLQFKRMSGGVRDDDYCLGRIGKEPMELK